MTRDATRPASTTTRQIAALLCGRALRWVGGFGFLLAAVLFVGLEARAWARSGANEWTFLTPSNPWPDTVSNRPEPFDCGRPGIDSGSASVQISERDTTVQCVRRLPIPRGKGLLKIQTTVGPPAGETAPDPETTEDAEVDLSGFEFEVRGRTVDTLVTDASGAAYRLLDSGDYVVKEVDSRGFRDVTGSQSVQIAARDTTPVDWINEQRISERRTGGILRVEAKVLAADGRQDPDAVLSGLVFNIIQADTLVRTLVTDAGGSASTELEAGPYGVGLAPTEKGIADWLRLVRSVPFFWLNCLLAAAVVGMIATRVETRSVKTVLWLVTAGFLLAPFGFGFLGSVPLWLYCLLAAGLAARLTGWLPSSIETRGVGIGLWLGTIGFLFAAFVFILVETWTWLGSGEWIFLAWLNRWDMLDVPIWLYCGAAAAGAYWLASSVEHRLSRVRIRSTIPSGATAGPRPELGEPPPGPHGPVTIAS
ncbi:MAG TPA: hypothetical protein VLA09_03355 [Longimicrobiales bacterium]|nr:hypothetical protein [Longimicrobiales bacterium]